MTEISMWDEQVADVTAEHTAQTKRLAAAAVEPLWPFLSEARTLGEFTSRLSLAGDTFMARLATVGAQDSATEVSTALTQRWVVQDGQRIAQQRYEASLRAAVAAADEEDAMARLIREAVGENGQCQQIVEGAQCRLSAGHNPPHEPTHLVGEVSVANPSRTKAASKTASGGKATTVAGAVNYLFEENPKSKGATISDIAYVMGTDTATAKRQIEHAVANGSVVRGENGRLSPKSAKVAGASGKVEWEQPDNGLVTVPDGTLAAVMGYPVDMLVDDGYGDSVAWSGRISDFDRDHVMLITEQGVEEWLDKDRIEKITIYPRLDVPADPGQMPLFAKRRHSAVQALLSMEAGAGDNMIERTCTNRRCHDYGTLVDADHEHFPLGKSSASAHDEFLPGGHLGDETPKFEVVVGDEVKGQYGTREDAEDKVDQLQQEGVTGAEIKEMAKTGARKTAEAVIPAGTEIEFGNHRYRSLGVPASTWSGYSYDEGTLFEVLGDGSFGQVTRAFTHKELEVAGITVGAAKTRRQAARDTGTCAECGRGISYDSSKREWYHDNEGSDTEHPAKKSASLEVCPSCEGDTSKDCEACDGKGVKTSAVADLLAAEAAFFHAPQAPNTSPFKVQNPPLAGERERDVAHHERVRREEQQRVLEETERAKGAGVGTSESSRHHGEAINERLDGLVQSDDFGAAAPTTPMSTRPRVMPDSGGDDLVDNPTTPMADNPDFAPSDPMRPTVGQRRVARAQKVAERIRRDNPTMPEPQVRALAARVVSTYPEMVRNEGA